MVASLFSTQVLKWNILVERTENPLCHSLSLNYFYRPQTKFAKVMFLHVSVCPRVGGVPGQVPPGQVHPPWAGTSPRAGTLFPPQCMLGYGQQAGGTHPTGMYSCSVSIFSGSECFFIWLKSWFSYRLLATVNQLSNGSHLDFTSRHCHFNVYCKLQKGQRDYKEFIVMELAENQKEAAEPLLIPADFPS